MKTYDLNQDFWLNLYDDGSATIRNPEIGVRINLPKKSVDLLRAIIRESADQTDEETYTGCAVCCQPVAVDEATKLEAGYLEGKLAHPDCEHEYAEEALDEAAHQNELWSTWHE